LLRARIASTQRHELLVTQPESFAILAEVCVDKLGRERVALRLDWGVRRERHVGSDVLVSGEKVARVLAESRVPIATMHMRGDPTVVFTVARQIGVQQVQANPTNLRQPYARQHGEGQSARATP